MRITTPWREAEEHVATEGRVPMLARGAWADEFARWHMTAVLGSPHYVYAFGNPSCSWIMCREDLDTFCKLWFSSNLGNPGLNEHITLDITLQDPYQADSYPSKALQQSLIMPFRIVKGLDNVTIGGYKRESVEKELLAAMAIPDPTPTECLENAMKHKDIGNTKLQASNYELAISKYQEAFASLYLDPRRYGERLAAGMSNFFNERVESGPHKGQNADDIRNVLNVQLTANTILAYLRLQDWESAHMWGSRAIAQLSSGAQVFGTISPTEADRAKLYYRTALALKGMGRVEEARQMLMTAAEITPKDRVIMKEIGELVS